MAGISLTTVKDMERGAENLTLMNTYETIHLNDYVQTGEGGTALTYNHKDGKTLAKQIHQKPTAFIRAMVGVSRENFEATLDLIDQKYGSLSQYIEDQLGFSKKEQQQLRTKYLE